MDTKSKSLNKAAEWSVLGILCVVFTVVCTYTRIFWVYQRAGWYWGKRGILFFTVSFWVGLGFSAVLVILFLWRLYQMYKKNIFSGNWNAGSERSRKVDRINTELLLLFLGLSGYHCMDAWKFRWNDLYIWDKYFLESIYQVLGFSLEFLLTALIFWFCVWILLRQWRGGILEETSLILKGRRNYLERTSLEKRIQKRKKGSLILAVILSGLIVWMGFLSFATGSDFPGIANMVLGVFCLIFFFKSIFQSRLGRETGKLVEQIGCITRGEKIPEQSALSEEALLYEASLQLQNIGEAMEKSIQKQIQAERLKIDLITNVSHDLKTPLTSMRGYTDLLKMEELSDEARDYVEIISVKQEQLKNMIQDLFELSKANSGAEPFVMEKLDMKKLLEQTMADMADAIENSAQIIRTHFDGEPLFFLGDNGKMYRVVQNLLGNALKYSMPGTRIYLDAEKQDGKIKMCLKNIAAYEMDFSPEEITERFVRGDKSRSTEGHGLGLAIASSFVKNMGGALRVEIDGDLFKVWMEFPEVKEKRTTSGDKKEV